MKKQTITAIIISLTLLSAITLFLFCVIPTETQWRKTIKAYRWGNGAPDIALSDDTKLDGMLEFVEVKCDFTVYRTLTCTQIKEGTIEFADRKYDLDTYGNYKTNNRNIIPVTLRDEYGSGVISPEYPYWAEDEMLLSFDGRYINLNISNLNGTETFHVIGGCETIGEIKEAVKIFGYGIPSDYS